MILYITKSVLCSGLFLAAYALFFEKEKMHRFNRFYLLSALALSLIIPLISFTSHEYNVLSMLDDTVSTSSLLTQTSNTEVADTSITTTSLLHYTLPAIYIPITSFLLIRFLLALLSLSNSIRRSQIIKQQKATLVLINKSIIPHSFFHYIFFNKEAYNEGKIEDEILLHELTHVKQKHTWDVMFIQLLQIVCWFNPVLLFYRRAIQLNHEFLADDAVIKACESVSSYQYLLIQKASSQKGISYTSQFNYSITKKRLLMMTKTTSTIAVFAKQLLAVPLLISSIFLFSTKVISQETIQKEKPAKVSVPSTKEGVSQELLDQYSQIVNKTKNDKGFPVYSKFTDADKATLKNIFFAMSKEQQAKQIVIFLPPLKPLPKTVPTESEFVSWKDSKIYCVWIDGKRVDNTELSKYSNLDFSSVFVSKLAKNTVNYGKHYYQVNLMTTVYYKNYSESTMKSKETPMAISYPNKIARVM